MRIESYVGGVWQAGDGEGDKLVNPVQGEVLATASSQGINLRKALEFCRHVGSPALQAMNYKVRASLLGKIADTLQARRNDYFEISRLNQGATSRDAAFDVDGAIYTLKQYAKMGSSLEGQMFKDGGSIPLSKSGAFVGQHFLKPLQGVAVFINAFNFPAWGLWEKAAPALLSGVPVFVKPAVATCWLTQQMVKDVIAANILPEGAISILCGSARDLLDYLREDDLVSFTGSARTAALIRSHPNVIARSVRLNVEADSLNSAILGPDSGPGTAPFQQLVNEVVREMTLKAGQKCTAIRRILVPREQVADAAEAISVGLRLVRVGDPAIPEVGCGPVVNQVQQQEVRRGISELRQESSVIYGGSESFQPEGADHDKGAFVQPTLLSCETPLNSRKVHQVEVFGPVATLLSFHDADEAVTLARLAGGSLVASLYSDDPNFKERVVLGIANSHGRIMVVDSSVGSQHTGHGNVMPSCSHGGPGRAGGGSELAGLRALEFYHRRFVMQGPPSLVDRLAAMCGSSDQIYG